MTLLSLTGTQAKVAGRQKALWFTVIPLTGFATLLAITSPSYSATAGNTTLTYTGTVIAIFTGIAYTAAFADLFTAPNKLGMQELEASTAVHNMLVRTARVLGAFVIVIAPPLLILLITGAVQTAHGQEWAIPVATGVTVTIVAPAALIAMGTSALMGAVLPRAFARIVAMLIWFLLVFSSPLVPLPTLNGTPLNVVGDTVAAGWFGASPVYPPDGPFGVLPTPLTAALSLAWQITLIVGLLVAGSWLADRVRKR